MNGYITPAVWGEYIYMYF